MTIADTSPLNYLLLIDEVHLLQKLFKGIIIPPDDHRAREVAQQLHLNTLGTLGILKRGARLGYTDLSAALDRLSSTNFRVSSTLLRAVRYRQQP